MAKNVFNATLDVNNEIKRNNFDLSFQNNFTTSFGRITPIMCKLLPPNSSVRIKPNVGLDFMPMVFPVQTPMVARMSFFKMPLRAMWKDYKDFVGNFKQGLIPPYVNINSQAKLDKMVSVSSLGDYLGIPTESIGKYGDQITLTPTSVASAAGEYGISTESFGDQFTSYLSSISVGDSFTAASITGAYVMNRVCGKFYSVITIPASPDISVKFRFSIDVGANPISFRYKIGLMSLVSTTYTFRYISPYFNLSANAGRNEIDLILDNIPSGTLIPIILFEFPTTGNLAVDFPFSLLSGIIKPLSGDYNVPQKLTLDTSPYYNSESSSKDKQIKLSAYPFRFYEAVYNAFYRDNRNNPYILNGQVEYNKWLPTDDGGQDDIIYELHQCNWNQDFLTTAVQSPQQGQAPLVGLTTYSSQKLNEDGTTTTVNKVALVDETGTAYGVEFDSDAEGLNDVRYTELDQSTSQVKAPARSLIDLAQSGISIADLRNVNCYQKYLELNMRKGYSYRDIVEGRFDVKVGYKELLMPEFIGGITRDVRSGRILQTIGYGDQGTYGEALGSFAGTANLREEQAPYIETFIDEESYIMCCITIVPIANYSQLLPKHWMYRDLLDSYNPEFNHIGFQPITYAEVCPIQAYAENKNNLTKVFGYQRPWYEYVSSVDEVHGQFRTNMRNFLINRRFDIKPDLSQQFLLVDPNQVNDVFAVTTTDDGELVTDKILGQVAFEITAKLPIARVAIPRLD